MSVPFKGTPFIGEGTDPANRKPRLANTNDGDCVAYAVMRRHEFDSENVFSIMYLSKGFGDPHPTTVACHAGTRFNVVLKNCSAVQMVSDVLRETTFHDRTASSQAAMTCLSSSKK